MIAEHFASLETDGVDLGRNGRVYPIVLGVKGDWNFLVLCMLHIVSLCHAYFFPWVYTLI